MALFCLLGFSRSEQKTVSKWDDITLIWHACGGIDDQAYTNSYEALNNSILSGCGAVEIDFRFTSDGVLICAHDWSDIGLKSKPTAKKFKKHKINDIYTTMTAEKALKRLVSTKVFLIVDTKEKDIAGVYKEIDRILSSIEGGEKYKNRIVPQLYSQEDYETLKDIYGYKNWVLTLYKLKLKKNKEYKELAEFCKRKGILTVTIPKEDITEERIACFTENNIRTAAHTVNGEEEWNKIAEMGVEMFYTDFGK